VVVEWRDVVEVSLWLLLLYGLTAVSTGYNAQYFWAYRAMLTARRRRLAALVLALLHGALFLENAYFSLAFLTSGSLTVTLSPVPWLALRAFLMAASASVSLLLLRSTVPARRR
jgi:hypothetical protein